MEIQFIQEEKKTVINLNNEVLLTKKGKVGKRAMFYELKGCTLSAMDITPSSDKKLTEELEFTLKYCDNILTTQTD